MIWDSRVTHERADVRAFLDHAAEYGMGSGIVVYFRDEHYSRTMFALQSKLRLLDDQTLKAWIDRLPDVLIFAFEFHAIFRRFFISAGVPPLHQGSPLSQREIQCLQLAARGLTSADIGVKLGLSQRTVDFHFCNIITKLDAANRSEAIALGMAKGLITA
jgi:LuxR family quorum-sensing transcriptional regulator LasR